MRRERIASVVTALALVLAAVGGGLGPVGTAQAQSLGGISNECYSLDGVAGGGPAQAFVSAAYQAITGIQNGCYYDAGSQSDYENISKTDAYSSALGIKDSADSYTTQVSNFQQDSRSVAYSKGKITMVRALENGTSESQAKFEANESVRDYYSTQILNIIKDWNAKTQQVQYLANQTPLTVGVVQTWNDYTQPGNVTLRDQNVTLPNGTVVTANIVSISDGSGGYADVNLITESGASSTRHGTIYAVDPATSENTTILNSADYGNQVTLNSGDKFLIETAQDQSEQVTSNLDPYVSEVYSQYQSGDLNATDIINNDPTLLAEQASTNYNSTGYYGYASVQLAAIGAAGDVNSSHVISVDGGANFTGTLFYTGEDRTIFTTGETYQFSNLNGTVYLAASDGPNNASGIVNLNEMGSSFTIESATNTNTGESVDNTTVQKFVYESTNASALQSEIDRLAELREFYQKQQANSGVGINLGTEDKAIIGVIAAVVLVLALRD